MIRLIQNKTPNVSKLSRKYKIIRCLIYINPSRISIHPLEVIIQSILNPDYALAPRLPDNVIIPVGLININYDCSLNLENLILSHEYTNNNELNPFCLLCIIISINTNQTFSLPNLSIDRGISEVCVFVASFLKLFYHEKFKDK